MNKRNVAAANIASSLFFAIGSMSPAVAETIVPLPKLEESALALPKCVNEANDIVEIQRVQKANHNSSRKYDGYRVAFQAQTNFELAVRLAYAETLAANCPQQEDLIVDLVTSVIGNRVRIRQGDVRGVLFQRNQFASSLNIYSESRYRDFLCPTDAELWRKATIAMHVNLERPASGAPIPRDAVNYYLHAHSDRFEAPDWKLEEVTISDTNTRGCIRVFRNPAWR